MAEDALLPVRIEKGMQYALHDGVTLTGDFYRPEGGSALPVMIAIHGGAWRVGDAAAYKHWGPWLAARGIALFSIEYRLTDGKKNCYPAAVNDVRAAVQFVRANAGRLGIDPERIGLIGDSAGGHLSSLVALAGEKPLFAQGYRDDPHAGISTAVKAVVGVYGVYDMLAQWEHDLFVRPRQPITELLLGVSPLEDKFRFFEASPYAHTSSKMAKTSFLITWGTTDDVVDYISQSVRFVTALKQTGVFVRTVEIVGAPHFWMSDPIEEPHSHSGFLAPHLLRFLREQL